MSPHNYLTLGELRGDDGGHPKEMSTVAERIAEVNKLTSPCVERRLRARQLLELEAKDDPNGCVPPKHVLQSLVRMGSFTASCRYDNGDHEDDDIVLPDSITIEDLMAYFRKDVVAITKLPRLFLRLTSSRASCDRLRVMQWNILSQTIGQNYDNFVLAPRRALEWKYRRSHILNEIIAYKPDIICLQEVDHFEFLNRTLSSQGYAGVFCPKPDSPCLHVKENNGPDGCAIFYQTNRFESKNLEMTVLPVWTIKSNQVAISILLQDVESGQAVCVATTHLKARSGSLMSSIRREQGRALLEFVRATADGHAAVICGDFNAEPSEPVYALLSQSLLNLGSAYAVDGAEPAYTSWKVREEGEQCQTLDYIFYTKNQLQVDAVLELPADRDIGECRLPSLNYPSDHLSLVCDLSFK